MKRFYRLTCLSALTLALVSVTACSKDDKAGATQVAAKVNSTELSVHQVNFVLSRSGAQAQTPEQSASLKKAALERLIDQQLAVEQALDKKLDRQPDVVMALELAKREVLARAYVEQLASQQTKPTEDEVKKYYSDHPELFSQRRVYNLQEIVFAVSSGAGQQVKDMVAAGKSMEDIAAFLKSRNIQGAGGAAQRAAEQIPLDLLPRVAQLKDGQAIVVEGPQTITVIRVAASQAQPVPEAQALPRVAQFLSTQRNNEALVKEVRQLREKSKITYSGEFAAAVGAAPAPAVTAPVAPAAPGASGDNNMDKGLRGLK